MQQEFLDRVVDIEDIEDEIGKDNLELVDITEEVIDCFMVRDVKGIMKLMEDSYKVLLVKDKS